MENSALLKGLSLANLKAVATLNNVAFNKSIKKNDLFEKLNSLENLQLKELIQTGKYPEAVKVQEDPNIIKMEAINLTSLSKTQLKNICKDKGLENYENLTNSQLKELIQTGKYPEAVKVPEEPIAQTFKINSHVIHTRQVVSINFIRAMVRDYCNFHNLNEEDKKELKVTLPNGTVLQTSKLSFIAQSMKLSIEDVQLFIQDASFGNKEALEKLHSFAKITRNTNRLPINWDVIGEKTKEPSIWLPLLRDALQLAVNERELTNKEALNIAESFRKFSEKNKFKFTFKPLKLESHIVATTLIAE